MLKTKNKRKNSGPAKNNSNSCQKPLQLNAALTKLAFARTKRSWIQRAEASCLRSCLKKFCLRCWLPHHTCCCCKRSLLRYLLLKPGLHRYYLKLYITGFKVFSIKFEKYAHYHKAHTNKFTTRKTAGCIGGEINHI